MSLSPLRKSQELIQGAKAPLIFLPPYPKTDVVAAAFALASFLEGNGAKPKIICDSADELRDTLSFVAPAPSVSARLTGARDFVISFQTKYNPISEVRTETVDDELRIYITPEKASIDPRDFSFQPAQFTHDVVIVLGTADKEHLGNCYESNPDVFYEVPVINIDHASENELYGQVNVVDLTASTVSEIVSEILEVDTKKELPATVYEYLLAGIIAGTNSFQKQTTSPKAFRVASLLMDHGADQQKIIKALYKTQPLHLLKLWGKVMANIKWNEKLALIWGTVSITDFVQARATNRDLPLVLEKIKGNYTDAKMYMLLHQESAQLVRVLLGGANEEVTRTLGGVFPAAERQGEFLSFTLEKDSLDAAEETLLALLDPSTKK
jgi:nanoRNase/pAp phosphatase (c-di-AMP/oligoRNAs hydrolase)